MYRLYRNVLRAALHSLLVWPAWSGRRWRSLGTATLAALVLYGAGPGCSSKPAPRLDGEQLPPPSFDPSDTTHTPAAQIDPPHPVQWPDDEKSASLLRVGLLSRQRSVRFEALGGVEVYSFDGRRLARFQGRSALRALPWSSGLMLTTAHAETLRTTEGGVRVAARSDAASFRVGQTPYADEMVVLRDQTRASTITLVNLVKLETYLRGVVPWEIGRPGEESLEAVKAQAIAARTYTLSHLGRREELGFDLWNTVDDQVYRGLDGVHPITDRAVYETKGVVLRFEDEFVQSYYSSTCGGYGSSIEDVWPRAAVPYLTGHRDAPRDESAWCRESPHFRWTAGWSAKELGDVLRENLPNEIDPSLTAAQIGSLRRIEVVERDPSGRVQVLRIVTDREDFQVWGDRIRWVLRPVRGRFPILRSTMFEVDEVRKDGVLVAVGVRGGGFGHGIGMCQVGALSMARAGHDAEDILQHYYWGVRLEQVSPQQAVLTYRVR